MRLRLWVEVVWMRWRLVEVGAVEVMSKVKDKLSKQR